MEHHYIYHITHENHWNLSQSQDSYRASSLESEGFIHCSTRQQILQVANHHYKHTDQLVLLVIQLEKLSSRVVFEGLHQGVGKNFPHVYGPINLNSVVQILKFPCLDDGTFTIPDQLL